MRKALLTFVYFLILTTSFQAVLLLWALWALFSSDYSLFSLTGAVFWQEYLSFILFIKDWLYTWFWNDLLNLVFGLPVVIVITVKLAVNTWLCVWLLPIARNMK